MATTITMPQLGETVTEGTVAQWLKQPGEAVEKYEPFVEISTDKVNAEVPSPVSGVIREHIVAEGQTVPTGAAIAVIDETGAATERAATPAPAAAAASAARASAAGASPAPAADERLAARTNGSVAISNGEVRRVSPAVRRLAREHGIDLAAVRGTGNGGRISANDVLAAASAGTAGAPTAPPSHRPASSSPAPGAAGHALPGERSSYAHPQPGTTVPLTPARRLIAQRMVESLAAAPHAWTMVEVDVSAVWAWRAKEKDRFLAERGYSLTLLPFFLHAVVGSLAAFPLLNAKFTNEGIVVHRQVNLGIAVALNANLVVPVIRDADHLSIAGLAIAAGKLIEKARNGTLGADDLAHGTFTVNNTGANGSILSKPIIPGGQAGIVTMEAVVKRPVVVQGDAIAVRSMMNVCLSLDHRAIDGAIASAFLVDLKRRLEAMGPSGTL
ncbi:MAG: dihydrolipoamide acetyltransferase family protein [Vulcanimicrobiaceae bacterium]